MIIKKFWLRSILKPLGYNLKQYAYRPFVRNLVLENKKDLIGIEIGVLDGIHALDIMEALDIKKLYLIDPWEEYEGYAESQGNPRKTQRALNKRLEVAKKVLKKYGNKVEFVRGFSQNVVDKFKDKSIDFVYIDGNHQYEYVKQDIRLYLPKVKVGGWIGGDDYTNSSETKREEFGVFKAVKEFFDTDKINFYELDWWVIKEEVNIT